jgi:hypothetical protein
MSDERRMIKARVEAAVALQKLVFRAAQAKGFVTTDDAMAVTDQLVVAVIEAFNQYLSLDEDQENEHAAH